MYELTIENYDKVRPLLKNGVVHPETAAVLAGNNPGWVFADSETLPRTALIWSQGMQGFYLIGDRMNRGFLDLLDGYITDALAPRLRGLGVDYFEISAQDEEWDLERIFGSREMQSWEQLVFKLASKPAEPVFPQGLRAIDLRSPQWREAEWIGKEFVENHIGMFWTSEGDFRQKGFGYAAVAGQEVAGVCYSSFVTEDTHAIGIETAPGYRGQGVGTILAKLVVNDQMRHGFTPYWDCSLDNEASRRLALRLGFKQVHRYTCRGFGI